MTGATSEAGTDYPTGAPEFTSVFTVARFFQSLVFCVYHCVSFCPFSGRHDVAEILLKVALNTKVQIQIPFSVSHCIIFLSIFGFWVPL